MTEIDTLYAFRRLFEKVAAEGREEALLGAGSLEKALRTLEKYALRTASMAIYDFEFPFTGEPRMDLLVGYICGDLSAPVRFAGEGSPSLQRFFDSCARISGWQRFDCGYSFDLSAATKDVPPPGLYLLPPPETPIEAYVPKFLEITGFGDRVSSAMAALTDVPKAWLPHYVGAMADRSQMPVRLGFSIPGKESLHYSMHPETFLRDIEAYMNIPFPATGKDVLFVLADGGFVCDLQFDLYPDGRIGGGLGVSVNFGFNDLDPRKSAGFLENGPGGDMMRQLEAMGLADARWRKMDSACGASQHIERYGYEHRIVGEAITIDGIKVRFQNGMPFISKGYLLAQSRSL